MEARRADQAPVVGLRAARMSFGGVEVLHGVDLDLVPGEVHAIVGENGAGKSTAAKLIAGVFRPSGGTVVLDGMPVSIQDPRHALELGIALIHQEPLTFPDLDIAENIFVGHQPTRRGTGVAWRQMRREARRLLDSLGVRLDPAARTGSLSVADQQMVELACALSYDARVLIMDETTASLTPKEAAELFHIVRGLRDVGVAVAFVSHHLDEVFQIADRITVMRDGEIVGERRPAETSVDEVVRLMVGRELPSDTSPRRRPCDAKPILEVRGLGLPGRFESIDLDVRPGEVVGLGGLVGAGRTDVCRAILGMLRPTAGRVEIDGKAVRVRHPRHALSLGLAYLPEDRQHEGLLMPMSIVANAALPVLSRLSKLGWIDRRAEAQQAEKQVMRVQTRYRSLGQPVQELSGGNQQKVVLAKTLLGAPRVLILDEPTRGVDVGAKAEVHRLILELVAGGLGVLMASSDLPELLHLSDRVLVMREGRIVARMVRGEATPENVMLAATGREGHAA